MLGTLIFVLIVLSGSRTAGQTLPADEMARAIALGQGYEALIIRLIDASSDFDGYVESPFARVALVAATARLMHQSMAAPGVQHAMRPGYRIWFERKPATPLNVVITKVSIRFACGEIAPVAESHERLFLGTVPSHGIVEALRARFPEFMFDQLPSDNFVVVLGTSRGEHRYTVTDRDRTALMRVCNG